MNQHIRKFLDLFLPLHMFLFAFSLVAIAAISNASMDTIDHHYSKSIFINMGDYFKNNWTKKYENNIDTGELLKDENGKYIRKRWFGLIMIHPMFFDAWHLFKVIMLGALLAVGMFAQRRLIINIRTILFYLVFGIISWILIFNVFYDHILLL